MPTFINFLKRLYFYLLPPQIMHCVNLSINVGQTVAFVGPSGCGKSTTIQLIQRFYDPDEGNVLLDGIDVKDLNIKWLRHQLGSFFS